MKRLILISVVVIFINACDAQQPTSPTSTPPATVAAKETKEIPMTGPMSFFVTSIGGGDGANYGGLEGADAHCQKLATEAGAGGKTWHAYLSTSGKIDFKIPDNNVAAIHARDRIGKGPWFNAKGELIARDVDHLHSGNNINKEIALSEKGNPIKGRGDKPNEHDILTGSRADGTAFAPFTDTTCNGWTSNGEGSAVVGHHDLVGPTRDNWSKSWNFAHQSRGCSEDNLKVTGGAGLLYCFAVN
ncbi:hypothetical protein [Kaarinaea lacus]